MKLRRIAVLFWALYAVHVLYSLWFYFLLAVWILGIACLGPHLPGPFRL